MATEDDVRRIALSLPETVEKPYSRKPGFRVKSKLFARIHELPGVLMVGTGSVEEKQELIVAEPDIFFSTDHYEGHPAVLVRLEAISVAELAEVITESWRQNASDRVRAAFDQERPPSS